LEEKKKKKKKKKTDEFNFEKLIKQLIENYGVTQLYGCFKMFIWYAKHFSQTLKKFQLWYNSKRQDPVYA